MNQAGKILVAAIAAAALGGHAGHANAAELGEGTVISKDNLDKVKGDSFEGKTIASMLTEKIEWQIRNRNLKIRLGRSQPIELDPRYVAATRKYSPEVKFDPATREATGWTAGIPFPEVSESDPHAGDKLIWNYYYASPEGGTINNQVSYLYITGDKGVDKVLDINFLRYYTKGRLDKADPVEGDGKTLSKTLIAFTYPYDVRGLSTFTMRYDTPQLEDSWVYVKSARRTRRLAGSSWMDPIGGSDQLNDDIYDKKNEFWKFVLFGTTPSKGETGIRYYSSVQGHTIDFKARHATIFINHSFKLDEPKVKADDVALSRLEAESSR